MLPLLLIRIFLPPIIWLSTVDLERFADTTDCYFLYAERFELDFGDTWLLPMESYFWVTTYEFIGRF